VKAVITCGGLGSRLLPFTKELPKEMLPIFLKSRNKIETKPLIQLIFENLYDAGIRDFCFITGKTKRSIENHFTPDNEDNEIMNSFYEKIKNSKIFWITQNETKGFGDAVRYAHSFVGTEKFILQAGDVAMINNSQNSIKELMELGGENYNAILIVRKVSDPKRHGIVTLEDIDQKLALVKNAIEKPDNPISDIGIMPIYLFDSKIFKYLENTKPGKNNEVQLTDAIEKMIENEGNVMAIKSDDKNFWDVGTPEAYWYALNESHNYKNV
jgi:UTP--glucose-1-phosphate uridylyltransferase